MRVYSSRHRGGVTDPITLRSSPENIDLSVAGPNKRGDRRDARARCASRRGLIMAAGVFARRFSQRDEVINLSAYIHGRSAPDGVLQAHFTVYRPRNKAQGKKRAANVKAQELTASPALPRVIRLLSH